MLILISDAFDSSLPEKLSVYGEVTEDKERLPEADVVLVRSKTKCTSDYIDRAINLKLIIRGGVGMDNIDREYAADKGIIVHNTPKASSIAVAELAFAMMLAHPNRIVEGQYSMKEGKWEKKALKRSELYGKTLVLLGIGNIATEVAKRASAFGMNVKFFDPYVDSSQWADKVEKLEDALAQADYVSMHLPLTEGTRHIIDAEKLSVMKSSAVLINSGRGLCVDADAVAAALEADKLGAYCTDVWPSDPPSEDYPILKAPRVLMTPHIGASSSENLLRIGDEVRSIIEANIAKGVL